MTCPRKAGLTRPARCSVPSICLRDRVCRSEVPGLCESAGRPHTQPVTDTQGPRRWIRPCLGRAPADQWLYLLSGTSVLCAVLCPQTAGGAFSRGRGAWLAAWAAVRVCAPARRALVSVDVQSGPLTARRCWAGPGLRPPCWEQSDCDPLSRGAPHRLGGAFLLEGLWPAHTSASRLCSDPGEVRGHGHCGLGSAPGRRGPVSGCAAHGSADMHVCPMHVSTQARPHVCTRACQAHPPRSAAGTSSPQSPIWRAGQFLMVHLLCFKFSLLGKNS